MLPKFCRRGNNENFKVCLGINCVHVCYIYGHELKKSNLEVLHGPFKMLNIGDFARIKRGINLQQFKVSPKPKHCTWFAKKFANVDNFWYNFDHSWEPFWY